MTSSSVPSSDAPPIPKEPFQEPEIASKVKISSQSTTAKFDPDNKEVTHFGEFSQLKASANANDFRLSDYNLERIHRFVDEPQKNVGSNMREVKARIEAYGSTVQQMAREVIGPYSEEVDTKGNSFVYGQDLTADHKLSSTKGKKKLKILEHEANLGDLSRFGDGDGTFWDCWIRTRGVMKASGEYTPGDVSKEGAFKEGAMIPRSGFKRFDTRGGGLAGSGGNPLLRPSLSPDRKTKVRPYSLYGGNNSGDKGRSYGGRNSPESVGSNGKRAMRESASSPTFNLYSRQNIIKRPSMKDKKVAKAMERELSLGAHDEYGDEQQHSLSDNSSSEDSENFSDDGDGFDEFLHGGGEKERPSYLLHEKHLKRNPIKGLSNNKLINLESHQSNFRRREHGIIKKSSVPDEVIHNYFGKGNGDFGDARDNYLNLDKLLRRQQGHFTREEYSKLLDKDEDTDEPLTTPALSLSTMDQDNDPTVFNIDDLNRIAGKHSDATPRTVFLYGCIQARDGMGLPPRMGPIIRKQRTLKIDLSHQGMGDELSIIFAKALTSLPEVQRIDLSDNRLSDVGVTAIIEAVMDKPDLTMLDIGYNAVDGLAAEILAHYIERPQCPLKELGLCHADVDDGECVRFIEALRTNKNLTSLDLSKNSIGIDEALNVVNPDLFTGGEAIAAMLACEDCNIKSLNLKWNLIRFNSALEIGESLELNTSLTDLDISYNAFGADGGMAIGQSLIQNSSLTRLDVSNNGITPQAAFCIAVALRQNHSLNCINLSGNPVGQIGGVTLMSLPMELGTRLELILDSCNFRNSDDLCWFDPEAPSGLFTEAAETARMEILERKDALSDPSRAICVGLDNYIGEWKLGVFQMQDPSIVRSQLYELIPRLHPELHLSRPYDRAVLIELLRFVADKEGCSLILPDSKQTEVDENRVVMMYTDRSGQEEIIELERITVEASGGGEEAENLKNWISRGSDLKAVFDKFDTDGSGEIDKDELKGLFKEIGREVTPIELERVFTQFDVDNSGTIELDEFLEFLKQLQEEIEESKYKISFMAKKGETVPWRAQTSGKCEFKVIYNPVNSERGEGKATNDDTLNRVIQQVKKTNGETSTMLMISLRLMRLGVEEGQKIFDELLKGVGDRVETLKVILPVIASPEQCRVMIDMNLKDRDPWSNGSKAEVHDGATRKSCMILSVDSEDQDMVNVVFSDGKKDCLSKSEISLSTTSLVTADSEKRRLQNLMGNSWYPIMGIPTRHYKLELGKEQDRICLRKLAALNNTDSINRRKAKLGDTSQRGNWMNFRNEVFRGDKDFVMTNQFLNTVKTHGILEFDYVSLTRPINDIKPLSDGRFMSIVQTAFGLSDVAMKAEDIKMSDLKRKLRLDFEHGLWSTEVHRDGPKFGATLASLYGEVGLSDPDESDIEGGKTSLIGTDRPNSQQRLSSHDESRGKSATKQLMGKAAEVVSEKMSRGGLGPNKVQLSDRDMAVELPKLIPGNKYSERLMSEKLGGAHKSFKMMQRMSGMIRVAARIQNRARKRMNAVKLLCLVEDMISMRWISAIQGRFLLDKFVGILGISTEDIALKLNLVCALHMRIVDLHNFDFIMGALSEEEQAKMVYRLGWLNTWSPLKPDIYYELSQHRREERLVSKALLHLAVVEPGENWWGETFQWDRKTAKIPGWELPITWFTEDGMPRKGVLKLLYYSGEGEGKEECSPRWKLRHALCGLVLAPCPKFLEDDVDKKYKSKLPTGTHSLLSIAQNMLLKDGIRLNYRQKM